MKKSTFNRITWVALNLFLFTGIAAYTQTPRGDRILAIDLQPYDGQAFSSAAADAVTQGVTTATIHLDWNQIESSPGVFTGPDAVNWQTAVTTYPTYGMNLILTIGTLDTCQRDVPSDLAAMHWNDPEMETRFQWLLSWLSITAANAGQPNIVVGLSIGSEADVLLSTDSTALDNFSDYTAFFNYENSYLKSSTIWNSVPVGVSTTFGGLTSSTPSIRSAVATLNTNADEVMYTYYPINLDFTVEDPYETPVNDTWTAISLYPGRTLDVFEAGYPTSSALGGSDAAQQTFVSTMFGIWDAYYPIIHTMRFVREADYSTAVSDTAATGACSGAPPVPSTPAAPTVTVSGTSGTTTWSYYIVAVNSNSVQSLPGATGQTTTGAATLTGTNSINLSWTSVPGASWYDVIRVSAGGAPSSTGKIGYTTGTTFTDTGLAASSYADITYNLEEYLRTLGLRYYDPVNGTYDKVGWTQLGTEAQERGW